MEVRFWMAESECSFIFNHDGVVVQLNGGPGGGGSNKNKRGPVSEDRPHGRASGNRRPMKKDESGGNGEVKAEKMTTMGKGKVEGQTCDPQQRG
jgi:hypothetical protein